MTKSQKDILHFGGAIFIFLIILSLIYENLKRHQESKLNNK